MQTFKWPFSKSKKEYEKILSDNDYRALFNEVLEEIEDRTQEREWVFDSQEMAKIMCKERNAKCFIPENSVLVDNALMIAWQGILQKNKIEKNIDIIPAERTDDVFVDWR